MNSYPRHMDLKTGQSRSRFERIDGQPVLPRCASSTTHKPRTPQNRSAFAFSPKQRARRLILQKDQVGAYLCASTSANGFCRGAFEFTKFFLLQRTYRIYFQRCSNQMSHPPAVGSKSVKRRWRRSGRQNGCSCDWDYGSQSGL